MSTSPVPDPELLRAVPVLPRRTVITGKLRDEFVETVVDAYDAGHSIRALAERSGRSYGCVHRALTESGTAMRKRGGDFRSSRRTEAAR
ncbi:helix-turn-helix domain-containing protein [Streptomyces sp. NPDC050161]|uniref:helix-turn-helix domain-containing protein n=1 Tax=Streptomyces sp. NPDC050161 TaxID=3365604 RepID=UPI0037A4844D